MSSEELKPRNEPQAHPDRCGCQPDAFRIARHSRRLVEQQRESIAALEAECERLRGELELALKVPSVAAMHSFLDTEFAKQNIQLAAERDAALVELSALKAQQAGQGPVGEMISNDGDIYWADRHPPIGAKLYAAPAPAPEVAGWIPVTERLPVVAQEVIVSTEFEGVCAGILDSYGEWFAPCSEYKLTRVTHWMPLPAAPAGSHDSRWTTPYRLHKPKT